MQCYARSNKLCFYRNAKSTLKMSQTTTRRLNILAGHFRNAPQNTKKQIHTSQTDANEVYLERPKPFRFELPYAYGEEKKQATIALREVQTPHYR